MNIYMIAIVRNDGIVQTQVYICKTECYIMEEMLYVLCEDIKHLLGCAVAITTGLNIPLPALLIAATSISYVMYTIRLEMVVTVVLNPDTFTMCLF